MGKGQLNSNENKEGNLVVSYERCAKIVGHVERDTD
jgi:hypothetical protein